jgi:hypothetical protein
VVGEDSPCHTTHTREHTSHLRATRPTLLEKAASKEFKASATHLHLVWGRVVPDIPDFCRELVAALVEE